MDRQVSLGSAQVNGAHLIGDGGGAQGIEESSHCFARQHEDKVLAEHMNKTGS